MTVRPERVILFGSEGGFSQPVLTRLLQQRVNIVAVVMPGVAKTDNSDIRIPVAVQPTGNINSLAGLAMAQGIPVIRTQDIHAPQLLKELSQLVADVLLLACFPLKLPPAIWQVPQRACWNLHPSLLPRYRGPTPQFWQLYNKEQDTGVSLHEVSEQLDAGNILAQRAAPLPAGNDMAALNEWVAEIGVELFLTALQLRRQGKLVGQPQDEAQASYFPAPDPGEMK